jgi:hypothetical protein
MFGIKRVVVGMLIGGGTMYFADHYHLVHTTEGLVVVPRAQQVPLRSSYADVRGWDAAKWAQYPELTEALQQDGRGQLIVNGSLQGLLQQAGTAFGVLPSATATDISVPTRPPIVFEADPGPVASQHVGHPTAPMQSAVDDSLLGRLTRQLQSNVNASASPAVAPTKPAVTAPLPTQSLPQQPLSVTPSQPSKQPQPANGRASLPGNSLPEDLYPSIHAAAMQRITRDLQDALETVTPAAPAVVPVNATEPTAAVPSMVRDVASTVLAESGLSPATDQTTRSDRLVPQMNAGSVLPLDIRGEELRERLPPAVQDTFRFLAPQGALESQPPAGQLF